jgi:hypothetical protein
MGELELGWDAMEMGFVPIRGLLVFLQPYSSRRIFMFAQAMMIIMRWI